MLRYRGIVGWHPYRLGRLQRYDPDLASAEEYGSLACRDAVDIQRGRRRGEDPLSKLSASPYEMVQDLARAEDAALAGDWRLAATLLEQASPGLDADLEIYWARAVAQLTAGDVRTYDATCQQVLATFDISGGISPNAGSMWELALHVCLLANNSTWRSNRLVAFAETIPQDRLRPYTTLARGRYFLRTGRPGLAIGVLPQPPVGNIIRVSCCVFLDGTGTPSTRAGSRSETTLRTGMPRNSVALAKATAGEGRQAE